MNLYTDPKSLTSSLQSRAAWNVILAQIIINFAILLIGKGPILIVIFPTSSLMVGFFLYKRYPVFYVSYTLWLWFLTAFISRLNSLKYGYLIPGGMACAPIVSWISMGEFLKHLPKVLKQKDKIGISFILCFCSILYSIFIRWILNPSPASIQAEIGTFLGPLAPILLGFYIYINWQNYPIYRNSIQKTFFWCVIVTGGYGLFLIAPQWDTQSMLWTVLQDGEGDSWVGKPEPLGIRVFSTMSSPFSFALNIMPGLILLNISNKKLRFLAAGVGYLSFLLSQVRTAWYSWLFAILTLLVSLKSKKQTQLILSLAILTAIVVTVASLDPFSTIISDRLQSISNFSNNQSFFERKEQTEKLSEIIMFEFIGKGFDVADIYQDNIQSSYIRFFGTDNGLIQFPLQLGWFGTIPYGTGVFIILSYLFRKSPAQNDIFAVSARAIVVANLVRAATQTILIGEYALPMWIFIGIGMSSYRYYKFADLNSFIS
jgi:hypothetical protein